MNRPANGTRRAAKCRPYVYLAITFATSALPVRAQTSSKPAELTPATPVQGELKGGDAETFILHSESGQFLETQLVNKHLRAKEDLVDSSGNPVAAAYSIVGGFDTVRLCAVAPTSGDYRLQVTSLDTAVDTGNFELRLSPARPSSATDKVCAQAQQSDGEGVALALKGGQDSFKQAALHFQKSASLWKSVGDQHAEAVSIYGVAISLQQANDTAKALELYNQALSLLPPDSDPQTEGSALYFIGLISFQAKKPSEAISYYKRAIPKFQAIGSVEDEAYAYNFIGLAYDLSFDKAQAADAYTQALSLFQKAGSKKGEGIASINLGADTDGDSALTDFTSAVQLLTAASDNPDLVAALAHEGVYHTGLQHWQQALDCFNKALAIDRADKNQIDEANELALTGDVYKQQGRYSEALDTYNQALTISQSLGDQDGQAGMLDRIGQTYYVQGNLSQAFEYFNQALPLARSASDRALQGDVLLNRGIAFDDQGEFANELDDFNQALAIFQGLNNRAEEAAVLNRIGSAYSGMNQTQKALGPLTQALDIFVSLRDLVGQVGALGGIANVHARQGELQQASDYYNQALSISRSLNNKDFIANALAALSGVEFDLGQRAEAIKTINEAIPMLHDVSNMGGEAGSLLIAANMYRDMGQDKPALDDYARALPLELRTHDVVGEATIYVNLMRFWAARNRSGLAILFGKQGIDLVQKLRQNMQGLPKDDQKSFTEFTSVNYRQLADLLVQQDRLPEAQQVLDQLKLEEYDEYSQSRGGPTGANSEVTLTHDERAAQDAGAAAEQNIVQLSAQWKDLDNNPSRTPEQEAQYKVLSDKISTANQAFGAYMDNLYQDFGQGDQANTHAENVSQTSASFQDLLTGAAPGTVALYTLVLDTKTVIILITPSVMVSHEIQISKTALQSKVNDFVGALANGRDEKDLLPKAQDLYTVLFSPLEKDLAAAHAYTLLWSLDGVLRYLPMAALYDGKQYLLERYVTAELTTASLGNLNDQPKVGSWSALAMGVSKDYDKLGPLASVPGELDSIVTSPSVKDSHGPIPGTILLNDSFTKESMEDALHKPPPLIHIATHFVFNPGDEKESYLLLGGQDAGGAGYRLSLADFHNDVRINFSGVELLTLSGCDTAMGSKTDSDGREVDSLGIVGQLKHAKAVVATLWPIEDRSVAQLMQSFYSLWTTTPGMSKSEALRQAQLTLLHGAASPANPASAQTPSTPTASDQKPPFANPHYWAPFILMGNWK